MSPELDAGRPRRVMIPLRKGSLVRLGLLAAILVLVSVWMLLRRPPAPTPADSLLRVVAAIGIALFGSAAAWAGRKVFDRAPALVLDAEGLIDNSSGLAAGRVRWDEILQIRVIQVVRHRYLSVTVRDPEKFIETGGRVRRKLNRANHQKVGTPINIKAATLAMPFDQVVERVTEFYRAYGRPA